MTDGDAMQGDEAAVAEWLRLDEDTRRAVRWAAWRGMAYPDPEVGAVAVRYVRAELRRGLPGYRRELTVTLLLTGLTVAAATAVVAAGSGDGTDIVLVLACLFTLLVEACALVALLSLRLRSHVRHLALVRMEFANQAATAEQAPVSTRPADGDARTVPEPASAPESAAEPESAPAGTARRSPAMEVRFGRRKLVWAASRAFASCVLAITAAVSLALPRYSDHVVAALLHTVIGLLCLLELILTIQAAYLARWLRWALSRRPVVTVDATGITAEILDMALTWDEVTGVRLKTLRTPFRPTETSSVLALTVRDPAAKVGQVKGRPRRLAIRALKYHGGPFAISDRWLDHRADEIASTIERWAPVPVTRW
jgi:hypothetical protein